MAANKFAADANFKVVSDDEGIPENWMGLDIGPKSVKTFCDAVKRAKTIVGMVPWVYSNLIILQMVQAVL